MGQQLSQGYSDRIKHSHSLIYIDCYETCAFALIDHTDSLQIINIFVGIVWLSINSTSPIFMDSCLDVVGSIDIIQL